MTDEESKKLAVPKATFGDTAHSVAKATLGSLPVVGSAASELFSLVIAAPLERRKNAWMESVVEAISELKSRGKVDVSKLAENEKFIDAITTASTIALRNSNSEKLNALRNAVLNAALLPSIDDTKLQMFLSLVDTLTPRHLQLLSLVADPPAWFNRHNKKVPEFHITSSVNNLVLIAYPEYSSQREMLAQIAKDLTDRGLASLEGFHTMMSPNGAMESRATRLGREFISFISRP